ncbi:MAG: hypothetical protein H0U65_12120 [Rubrobacter sp.]|jgi:hypothetical protein|nr:hypothetical protein [Rubrobacter sp.]
MAELRIVVDEETLEHARVRARQEGTAVDAVMRGYLEEYAGSRREQIEAARRIIEDARRGGAGSGPEGRTWKREDIYEERLGRYGKK